MLELDKNQEAATYAEESVQYFREACSDELGKEKYGADLIFSLSLASACLACTERANDAFAYAKQAVEVQHKRTGTTNYKAHLGKLLLDVVFRATEMNKQEEAYPWFQELESLGGPGVMAETMMNLLRVEAAASLSLKYRSDRNSRRRPIVG
ncbi:hypothetical protein BGW80DRAFT_923370 [Lactifluus volemus]|nr:hypothetical protein BGW80DRAFT_923370 [Lactifluus volemus]